MSQISQFYSSGLNRPINENKKKRKKHRKQKKKQDFLALGDLMRSFHRTQLLVSGSLVSSPTVDVHDAMVERM